MCYFHVTLISLLIKLQLREKRVYDVKTIAQSITQGARNELEKVRAIWVWLCHNIGERVTCMCPKSLG